VRSPTMTSSAQVRGSDTPYQVQRSKNEGHTTLVQESTYALKDVAVAHMDLESRKTSGKLLLAIGD
jgi:hypothetical protein